jgi:aminoglycoside phosphotransferase (APT) family kinase protein
VTLAAERDLDELRVGLERWLGRPVGEITRPAPGWSCETLIVARELVIRLPPLGDGIFPVYDLEQQAAVQCRVPVAVAGRYEPDPSFLGAPFAAMPFVGGPIPAEFTAGDEWLTGLPDDAARTAVWTSFVDATRTIHAADPAGLGLRAGLAAELDFWDGYLAWATDGDPPARLADALGWCRANAPEQEPAGVLLWGDVRFGNVVFDPVALAAKAVLDWDMASIGPSEMDIAWFLALEQVQADLSGMTVPGFGTRDQAVARFEAALDRPLVDLDWYETFALVRASAVSTRIALLHERAGRRSMFKVGRDPTLAAAVSRIEDAPTTR